MTSTKLPFSITQTESDIFELIKNVLIRYNLKTIVRVAGGWVRDHFLGKPSEDIDLALDDMSGIEFAEKINEYMIENNMKTHSIGKVPTNPDQSKHLETACIRVLGLSIDIVNLRTEVYTSNSRIPTVCIGTPQEDAYRRDLTINSLFFNINTFEIEDFTGKGILHLKEKVIATPLTPLETFTDDPLRVLRSIRFASRLIGYHIDPELLKAAQKPQVINSLAHKISKERIGAELDGMLRSSRPELALHWIYDLGLFSSVFQLPDKLTTPLTNLNELQIRSTSLVRAGVHVLQNLQFTFSAEEKSILLMSLILYPYHDLQYLNTKKRTELVNTYIVKTSIKKTNDESTFINLVHSEIHKIISVLNTDDLKLDFMLNNDDSSFDSFFDNNVVHLRRVLGGIIRRLGEIWRIAFFIALIVIWEYKWLQPLSEENIDSTTNIDSLIAYTLYKSSRIELNISNFTHWTTTFFLHLTDRIINKLDLDKVWLLKPHFKGKEIAELLNIPIGPMIGKATELQIEWMLGFPKGGDKDLCKQFLLDKSTITKIQTTNLKKKTLN